jgi:hypothetical protein
MEEYTITKGLFDSNSRKYINIESRKRPEGPRVGEGDLRSPRAEPALANFSDSTPGAQSVEIRLKIPFRYNRVMCTVTGDKTVQEMIPGDKVLVKMKNCGRWEIGEYSGTCYKCEEISFVSST